jgi:hypothetical protein
MVQRQRTAFSPNFVHSLDSSHMMMTAVACKGAGLNFAGFSLIAGFCLNCCPIPSFDFSLLHIGIPSQEFTIHIGRMHVMWMK